jgi:hypothetical protein
LSNGNPEKTDYNQLPNSRNDLSTLQFGIGGLVICSQIIDDAIEILLGGNIAKRDITAIF